MKNSEADMEALTKALEAAAASIKACDTTPYELLRLALQIINTILIEVKE